MTKKLKCKWDRLKFPPINLLSAPKKDTLQEDIDFFMCEIKELNRNIRKSQATIKIEEIILEHNCRFKELAEKQLKSLEFKNYLKTGKFND